MFDALIVHHADGLPQIRWRLGLSEHAELLDSAVEDRLQPTPR